MLSTPALKPSSPPSLTASTAVIAMRHPAMRSALWALVEGSSGVAPIGATSDLRHTATLLHFTQPELVLVDAALVGGADLPDLAILRAAAPHAAFIVIGTGEHASYATTARRAGASDYVLLDDVLERLPDVMERRRPER